MLSSLFTTLPNIKKVLNITRSKSLISKTKCRAASMEGNEQAMFQVRTLLLTDAVKGKSWKKRVRGRDGAKTGK